MIKNATLLFLLFISSYIYCYSQSNVSLNLGILGFHFFDKPNASIYENKLDSNGNFVAEPHITIAYEVYIRENYLAFEFAQGLYFDATAQPAGYTFAGIRRGFYHKGKKHLSLILGPVLSYRGSWDNVLGYVPQSSGYTKNGNTEVRIWGLAKLDYTYLISYKSDLSVALIYGYSTSDTFTFTVGYKRWINTLIRHPKPCDCGGLYKKKKKFKYWFK